LALLKKLLFLL